MKSLAAFTLVVITLISGTLGRPPVKKEMKPSAAASGNDTSDWDLGIEYNRYLQEIVTVLESDPEFRKKLETAEVDKIRDGSIAHELEFVHHNVRSKLDEVKRRELERLRHLATRKNELAQGIDKKHMKIPQHVEIKSPTFEIDDLKRLIKSTTRDLEEADKKRRDDFKRYEMEKKFEEEERLQHIEDEAKRGEEKKRLEDVRQKHKSHDQVNHPMTKDQLEEVWEKQDHMRPEDWDPKTFFAMHDLNGDNYWDEDEVRVLFKKELDKVYDPNAPEDDMREREEEMERMREHVFRESDVNKDRLISYEEFLAETKRDEFEKDPGWNTMDNDEQDDFSDDEFRAYQMQRQREIQDMLNRGVVPEGYPYYGNVPHGAAPYQPPHPMQQHPGGAVPGSIPGQPAFRQDHDQKQFGGHPQQFGGQPQHQGGQPQQFGGHPQQGQPQQFGGHPQQGQPQQFGGQPQHHGGQPQQFGGHPQQGQPQQFGGHPQQGQPQQFGGQPQQFGGQPQHQGDRGQPQLHGDRGQPQQQMGRQPPQEPQLNRQPPQPQQASGGQQQPPQPRGNPPIRAQPLQQQEHHEQQQHEEVVEEHHEGRTP